MLGILIDFTFAMNAVFLPLQEDVDSMAYLPLS